MTAAAKHTPGPWKAQRGSGDYGMEVVADRKVICETISPPHDDNAHLIAAAPDLLSACKFLYERSQAFPDFYNETFGYAQAARAAIAKAQGGAA